MGVLLNPYLSFTGEAREALNFYHDVFGGELTLSTFGEFGVSDDPADSDQIMHGQLAGAAGLTLMASDTPKAMEQPVKGSTVTLSVSGDDEALIRGYWDALAEGATVTFPLAPAPWGDTFGQLTDRFGTAWMFNIAGEGRPA